VNLLIVAVTVETMLVIVIKKVTTEHTCYHIVFTSLQ
jgi:hypothetical protein